MLAKRQLARAYFSQDVVYTQVRSIEEVHALASHFAETYLTELLKDDGTDTSSYSVVALYGAQDNDLNAFHEGVGLSDPASLYNVTYISDEDSEIILTPSALYRWHDFGKKRLIDNPSVPSYCESQSFMPRGLLAANEKKEKGFDLLAHPPLSHLNGADIVVLFGGFGMRRHPYPYYGVRGVAQSISPDMIGRSSTNPRALVIAKEMHKMRWLALAQARPEHKDLKTVSIILTSQDEPKRRHFEAFSQKYKTPKPAQ